MYTSTPVVVAGLSALFAGVAQAQSYVLGTTFDASNFFDNFDFFTDSDPTHGFVQYVDQGTANSEGLANANNGTIYMGVDSTTQWPDNGRQSVRVSSQMTWTHGLFIADIAHMPSSTCGSWPAYWLVGPNWPNSGEIDIIEGVNTNTQDQVTLHTSDGCSINNDGTVDSTTLDGSDCEGNSGCGQSTGDNQNYGDGFNNIGGGVYATEWTSDHISVWFFPRSNIPSDISSEQPDPSGWGAPAAKFNGGDGCDIDSHFNNHQIVFDTTFCGDWAGNVWGSDGECSSLADSCQDYVAGNPGAFVNSYWNINYIKVYNQNNNDQIAHVHKPRALRS